MYQVKCDFHPTRKRVGFRHKFITSKFRYRLTKRAESDLDGIVSYIAVELAKPQAASDFVNKPQDNIEETRVFPESGSRVDNEFLQVENIRKKK